MKKTLLSFAALTMVTGAWAQDAAGLIDVTPNYYKFNKDTDANLESILRSDVRQPAAFNLGSNFWITNNSEGKGENYFSAEQLANGNILFGAYMFNKKKEAEFAEAFSLYNLGGNLGQVLILNGEDSKLNEAIQTAFGLDVAPEFPSFKLGDGANFQYNHLLDWPTMQEYVLKVNPDLTAEDILASGEKDSDIEVTPIRIRVRVELNAYNNDMSQELNALNSIFVQNEVGNIIGGSDQTMDGYIDVTQFSENNVWNPNLWLVREFDMDYAGIASYIKFLGSKNESDFNNGALLVRSIDVFILPEGTESYPNLDGKTYSNYVDNLIDYSNVAVEPETLYVIGANVDGESWALETNQMTYANNVYTWKGSELYSGFKINNGTWDSNDYNIGAGTDAALVLGTPYSVIANAESGNITFDGYDYVENVTVVYDPKSMTVTVTGTGVKIENVVLYVRGEMNGWGTDDVMNQNDNIYTYSFTSVAPGQASFKIADANWSTYNFGGDAMDVFSNNPGVQTLVYNGGSITISNWVEGPMQITFNIDTKELTVEGANQPVDPNSGISSINSDNSEVEYYNMQGVKVANPQNGIYIIRKGNTTSKAVIR